MMATHRRRVPPASQLRCCLVAIGSLMSTGTVAAIQDDHVAPARFGDNGIKVGAPKIYDTRELTLQLDSLSQQLQGKSFIDVKALATALGNVQGYQSSDFSQSFLANGAVGPQAASVFAGTLASQAPTAATTNGTAPSITINLTPSATTTPTTSTTPAATPPTAPTPLGPQPPTLPPLETAPTYTPTFGENSSDLLSDEVNLTYQLSNVRMLLTRSLTDRLYSDPNGISHPRQQAVVGFDIDLVPDHRARDAVAVVEVTASMPVTPEGCGTSGPTLVALMPEEGSHNAATLSQSANAFGGAVAAAVFSVGYQAQWRSQVFYLYRDMDTVSLVGAPHVDSGGQNVITFGWQFRPVLGRHIVTPGLRHLMAVIGLPCQDDFPQTIPPALQFSVHTEWVRYDASSQTAQTRPFWFRHLPPAQDRQDSNVQVPNALLAQSQLQAHIDRVTWIPTDSANGIAVVTGGNFFTGTTVRIGGKTFTGAADGLTFKSDQELEIALPLAVAVQGGALSGRYGPAVPLQSAKQMAGPPRFSISALRASVTGSELFQLDTELTFDSPHHARLENLNLPVVLVNGVPVSPGLTSVSPFTQGVARRTVSTFVPANVLGTSSVITVTFPFAGPGWSASLPWYETTVKVARLGSDDRPLLLITASNRADQLCRDEWNVELDAEHQFGFGDQATHNPEHIHVKCIDDHAQTLALELPAKLLNSYHHLLLKNPDDTSRSPLVGDIPDPSGPPPKPKVDTSANVAQYDVSTIEYKGDHLAQINKVLFETLELPILKKADKSIDILVTRPVSEHPRKVTLQLLSPANDPVTATLTVTAPKPTPAANSAPTTPAKAK